jgi:ribonuclease HI
MLFFDGSAHQLGGGAGVVLFDPSGDQVKYMLHLEFKATNNMAEYEALIFGLSAALSLGIRQLLMKGDSQLIIKQVRRECSCNEPRLAAYLLHVRKLENDFIALELQHVLELTTQQQMNSPRGHQLGHPCPRASSKDGC